MLNKNHTYACFKKSNDHFIQYLVHLLGPVILGVKPSEILSFPIHDPMSSEKIEKIDRFFSKCKKISYKVFNYNQKSIKVFFYNPKSLDTVLIDPRNTRFLKSMGYPENYSLDSYLIHLIEQMTHGVIPDEIGTFLGYPLKDVIGFIGHPSLKLTKINGWRVYGDASLSDKRYNEFLKAKDIIKNLLAYSTPDKILAYA